MARAANMQALTNDIKSEHPGVVIYGIGDAAHKRRTSDHNEDDTPGSKATQSDPDNRPEHRAIDVMLGPAMSRAQMYVIINRILNDPRLRARLWYINFENYKWSRSNGWIRSNNSNDPHPNHGHFSGWAANDEDASAWFTTGGNEVLKATRGMGQNGQPPHDNVLNLQRQMNYLIEGTPYADRLSEHPLSVDGNYGGGTAYWVSVLLTGGEGNEVNGDWFSRLGVMVADKRAMMAFAAHLSTPHGGELPHSVQLNIPSYTVPAQTLTVPLEEGN